MTLAFVKLGGSALTDKTTPESLDEGRLRALAQALARLREERPELRVLLGHGGGSFGHYWAHRYGTAQGIGADARHGWEGFARVTDAVARLNRAVIAQLLEAGVPAVGLAPSASGRSSGGALRELATGTLETLLEAGCVPVVYGDVVVDEERGCAIVSTETLFSYLAPRLRPRQLILLGAAAVYTADPHADPAAQPIPLINSANYEEVRQLLGGAHGVDVTGGMRSKVEQMWALIQQAPELVVRIVGPEPDLLLAALRGAPVEPSTTIQY